MIGISALFIYAGTLKATTTGHLFNGHLIAHWLFLSLAYHSYPSDLIANYLSLLSTVLVSMVVGRYLKSFFFSFVIVGMTKSIVCVIATVLNNDMGEFQFLGQFQSKGCPLSPPKWAGLVLPEISYSKGLAYRHLREFANSAGQCLSVQP